VCACVRLRVRVCKLQFDALALTVAFSSLTPRGIHSKAKQQVDSTITLVHGSANDFAATSPAVADRIWDSIINEIQPKHAEIAQDITAMVVEREKELRGEALTPRRKRNLSPKATEILSTWFNANLDHPYASDEEKEKLAAQAEITVDQVTTWLSNKRSRSACGSRVRSC
jgi:hypothetical protein